jgi:AcrR family transcriptional regulator
MLLAVARQRGSRRRPAAFASGRTAPTPRKRPVQDRSRTTVDAILTATFQVLDRDGADGLTTTRVAEVAGVSVGTLYQYFPNKQALVAGLLAAHLDAAIDAVARAAAESAGAPIAARVERVVRAFVAVKAERAAISRAMQPALAAIDERPIVRAATRRAAELVAELLAGGPPDAAAIQRAAATAKPEPQDDGGARARLLERAIVVCSAMEGIIATAIAEAPARLRDPAFVDQLVGLARGAVVGSERG